MLKEKTVVVVGAGAGVTVNMPTGDELAAKISQVVSDKFDIRFSGGAREFDLALQQVLAREEVRDATPAITACCLIKQAMVQSLSIDNFIHIHRGDGEVERCGKLAISHAITDYEAQSLLNPKLIPGLGKRVDFDKAQGTWYNLLIKLLTEYNRYPDLLPRLKNLTLVIFNYDRCVEHFLFHSFKNVYGVEDNLAAELVGQVTIFHPYGSLGVLEWQSPEKGTLPFGGPSHPTVLSHIWTRIRTFTEGTSQDAEELGRMRNAIHEAGTVVFLGFGFHPLNMELLFGEPRQRNKATRRVLATGYKMSEEDGKLVQNEIARYMGISPVSVQLDREATCEVLISKNWRTLSQS